ATGMPLNHFLSRLILMVEEQLPGVGAAAMVRSADGRCLQITAAPSLPPSFVDSFNGILRAAGEGRSENAALLAKRAIVENVRVDPFAANWRHILEDAGLTSWWSFPITSFQGDMLGAISLFLPEPASPDRKHD